MLRADRTECPPRGFTLVEVLVALVLFAIASMIAYQGLNAVTETKAALDREIRRWRELGLVFDRIDADLLQSVPQDWQSDRQTFVPPMRARPLGDNGFFVEFTRLDGNRLPIRVTYRCEAGRLELHLMSANRLSAASSETATTRIHPLLAPVERCEAGVLDAGNVWRTAWPLEKSLAKPRAIRIRLELAGDGQFERIYYLP